jgi:hypothetical protein
MAAKRSKSTRYITISVLVIAIFMVIIGVTLHNIRNHQSPNDIKSIVISSYNGSQSPETQTSKTLTLTPTSCTYTTNSPTDGNFAPTTTCLMNVTIWNAIAGAYFTNALPTQTQNQSTPATGPIVLLGVYYNDGTSNTVYFSNPLPANFQNFLQLIQSYEPAEKLL